MYHSITNFIEKAKLEKLLDPLDEIYTTNQLLHLLQLEDYKPADTSQNQLPLLEDSVDEIIQLAIELGVIEDILPEKEAFEAAVMNLLTPLPSVVNANFWNHYKDNPEKATDYFYELSQKNHYIQTRAIAKNIQFPYSGKYGTIEITINLSKPEKDPKAIAQAKLVKQSSYPASQLTMTNEGYYGRFNHPARSNHRIIRLEINHEDWGFQYSPYSYFNEHSIFLTQVARPMQITERSFENLMDILRQFPHYFVGSNADLPIVGGSILVHDHYQSGRHVFPMDVAPILENYSFEGFDGTVSRLHWPLSVIRLASKDTKQIVQLATHILDKWRNYSDESADILAFTEETPHNTITPIARVRDGIYELDLVLRNNRTTEEFPDGIFHPHVDVHPIKKENIGLIEVMGLAILPPRLKTELKEVENYLLGQAHQMPEMHKAWANEIKDNEKITSDNVETLIRQKVGEIFERGLENAGVFKQTTEGQEAFGRFIDSLQN